MRRYFLFLIATAVCFLGGMEAALRVFPAEGTSLTAMKYDPVLGWLWDPDKTREFSRACFRTRGIRINQHGFRSRPFIKAKTKPRIGVFGDSYMEALQMSEGQFFAPLLEQETGYEVYQFGHRGIGVSHNLATYEKFARRYDLDAVVLGYLLYNDAADDYPPLGDTHPAWAGSARMAYENGEWRYIPPKGAAGNVDGGLGLQRLSYLWRFLRFNQSGVFARSNLNEHKPSPPWYGEFKNSGGYLPPTPEWREAWLLQDRLIERFKTQVEADGGKLLVMTIPGPLEQAPDNTYAEKLFKRDLPGPIPKGFHQDRPLRALTRILDKYQVPRADLVPKMRNTYAGLIDGNSKYAIPCDGHWNAAGHRLAASFTGRQLKVLLGK